MGIVIALALGIFVFSIFVMGHPTSVIARKTDQSDTAEVLAWIPGLQIIPMIWAAGARVWQVLAMSAAVLLSAILMGFASGAMGDGALAGLLSTYAEWGIDVYFLGFSCWLGWRIADRRSLPPVFGLLLALPLLNIVATWVLAFHDGWAHPHRGGLAAACVLSLALALPGVYVANHVDEDAFTEMMAAWGEAAMAEQMAELEALQAEQLAEFEAMETEGAASAEAPNGTADPAHPTERPTHAANAAPAERPNDRTIRALFALKGRFEQLDALTGSRSSGETASEPLREDDRRTQALALVENLRSELRALHGDLDSATYAELSSHLVRVESTLQQAGTSRAPGGGALTLGSTKPPRTTGRAFPASLAAATDAAPIRPLPVEVAEGCPAGTELRSRESGKGEEEWCQQLDRDGGLRHGWYARYFGDGRPEQVGEYREGLRVGVWTRFHPSGSVRAQAEFDAGLQHGWLLTFSETGERKQAVRFEDGTAVQ